MSKFYAPQGANLPRHSCGKDAPEAPLLFPSDEWVLAWIKIFNDSELKDDFSESLQGRWRIAVERDRSGPGGTWDIVVDGKNNAKMVPPEEGADLRGEINASHDRWYKLLNGSADLRMSLLTRRVHVEGDLKELRGISKKLVSAGITPSKVPTFFLCESWR